jgi:predicted nuclease of predicted toxin-antitoxin system
VKVKLDENIPVSTSQVLMKLGHDVETVIGEGLAGRDEATVLAAASSEDRLLVTLDRGFGDVRAYPPGSHGGIVVLRPDSQSVSLVLSTLSSLTTHHDLEEFRRCIVIDRGHLVRVRRPASHEPQRETPGE